MASGDDIPNGNKLDDNASRFPEQLLADHLISPGWCLYNQGKNGTTSSSFISGGGMATAYNSRPDLHTITLGEQNSTVVDLITSCFDKVKDHDFAGGAACASAVLANSSRWTNMTNNYTTLQQTQRIMASQRPGLVVAVTTIPTRSLGRRTSSMRSRSSASRSSTPSRPAPLDGPSCPPALLAIDQAFKKLNTTIQNAHGAVPAGTERLALRLRRTPTPRSRTTA